MRIEIVIPARLASTRLPEKLLLRAGGRSVLEHTYRAASCSRIAAGVTVAVDHPRLREEVEGFGGRAVMTDPGHVSGTDRIAEVARALPEVDIFVNVQGDEPEIDPAAIDLVGELMLRHPDAAMATVGTPIREASKLNDPACVKIVMGGAGEAIYFSRATVPFAREGFSDSLLHREPPLFWQHLGLYAYRRDFLDWFSRQPPGSLELVEKLEQLRALEAGKRIMVGRVERAGRGIDTPEDFAQFKEKIEAATS
jgi:3-deoxy-manno-octulosonate cytidylyltransferase (CMP-KDO synthetase)